MKQTLELFCTSNVEYPVTDKILSQRSPIHILNSNFLSYIVFEFFCLSRYFPNKVFFIYFLTDFLYLPLPCVLGTLSHLTIFSIILTLFGNLIITNFTIILFHPDLLPLPLFTSRYLLRNIFFLKDTQSQFVSLCSQNLTLIQSRVPY